MARKRKRIVRYTDRQLKAMGAAGKTGSDWKRAARAPVPEGSDRGDAIGPVDIRWADDRAALASPQGAHDIAARRRPARLVSRAGPGLPDAHQRRAPQLLRATYPLDALA